VPLADTPMRVLEEALRDPAVVARYRAKVLKLPGSYCLWRQGAVGGGPGNGEAARGPQHQAGKPAGEPNQSSGCLNLVRSRRSRPVLGVTAASRLTGRRCVYEWC
jgi:hypothetical protein